MAGPWDDYATPDNVASLVTDEAQRQGVDPALALRLAHQESGLHPGAVSAKGAVGVMQLMPDTAKTLGVDPNDLGDNVRGGVTYLKQQLDTFGDPKLAAAAYNAGPEAVKRHGGVPPYPETQAYVQAVAPGDGQPQTPPWLDYGSAPTAAAPAPVPARTAPGLPAQIPLKAPVTTGGLVKSYATGVAKGTSPIIDTLLSAGPLGAIKRAADMAAMMSGHGVVAPPGGVTPAASWTQANGHAPQNIPEQYADTLGQMTPNAAAPASIPARIANVVLPALGSETAGQVAHGVGASPLAERIARFVGAVGGGGLASLRLNPQAAAAPSAAPIDDLREASDKAWNAVDASGYRFPKDAAKGVATDIRATFEQEGGADLYPKAAPLVKRIESLTDNSDGLSVAQVNRLRSQIGTKLLQPGNDEADMGRVLKDKLESLIQTADDPSLANARDLYTRLKKAEAVQTALGSADLAAGGNAAIPGKLRPLIDPKSGQRIRNLTPDEQSALTQIVKGNGVTKGLAAMDSPFIGAGLKALTWPTHGASLALNAAGAAAKASQNAANASKAQALLDLMASGGVRSAAPSAQPLLIAPDTNPMLLSGLLSAVPAMSRAAPPQRRQRP